MYINCVSLSFPKSGILIELLLIRFAIYINYNRNILLYHRQERTHWIIVYAFISNFVLVIRVFFLLGFFLVFSQMARGVRGSNVAEYTFNRFLFFIFRKGFYDTVTMPSPYKFTIYFYTLIIFKKSHTLLIYLSDHLNIQYEEHSCFI